MKIKPFCPRCKSNRVATILWGLPAYDEEMQRKMDSGEIVLGGCCIPPFPPPDYQCLDCGLEFYNEGAVET